MPLLSQFPNRRKAALLAAGVLVLAFASQAQRGGGDTPAQIGPSAPLPVYVTNTPSLPEGFVAGSHWRFVTWTTPSVMTWTASVNRISGPWANLTVRGTDNVSTTRWYYIPGMPGSWEPQ